MRFMHLLPTIAYAIFATAAARAIEQVPLLRHASTGRNVSVELFSELEELARIVDISYCVGLTSFGIIHPFTCLSRCSDFPRFELVTTWNTGQLMSDSCGYIALDHGKERIIVAFRGTYSVANTVIDLSTIPQEYVPYPGSDGDDEPKCANCTVHMGFHTSWLITRKQILPDLERVMLLWPHYNLELVGHSLGGAVAALAGLDLLARGRDPRVTTFGEPRLGNKHLVKYIDDRFHLLGKHHEEEDYEHLRYRRVTHIDDPVPLLPLNEWGFAMHAGEIYISKPALSPDLADLQHCKGNDDLQCIAGQDSSVPDETALHPPGPLENLRRMDRDLLDYVAAELLDVKTEPWGIPSRYKLWQLFFAHRDYFWRLGLCVPGGDPLGGGGKYGEGEHGL